LYINASLSALYGVQPEQGVGAHLCLS
jgi:hypothetical protein